jgi:hypothetical protein
VFLFAREILLVIGVALAYLLEQTSYLGYARVFGFLLIALGVYAICGRRFRKQPAYIGYVLGGMSLVYWGGRDIARVYSASIDGVLGIVDPIFMILAVAGGVLAVLLSDPRRR